MLVLAAAFAVAAAPALAPEQAALLGKRAVALLTAFGEHENPELRAQAASAWGEIGNSTAIPLLKKALRDRNIGVRLAAADSLRRLGEFDAARDALTAIIKKPNPAASSPDQQMRRLARDQARARAVTSLSEFGGEAAVELFETLLKDPAPAVREATSQALARMGLEEFGDPFIEAAHDKDDEVRATALRALGEISLPVYFPAVRDATVDPAAEVRLEAVAALSKFKGREPAAALELALRDEDPRVRAKALAGLAKIPDIESLATLRAIRNESKTPEVALKADAGLVLRGEIVELGLAERTLASDDPDLKLLALEVIRLSDSDEATRLLQGVMERDSQLRARILAASAIIRRLQRRRG